MSELPKACPHCGCTEAYGLENPVGKVSVNYDLENRVVSFDGMWDGLTTEPLKYLHCVQCGKRIGRYEDAAGFRPDR